MTTPAANILIVGPSWVGDMVMAQSLVQTLQQTAANPNIDILAPAYTAALVARMPGVRRHIAIPVGHGELGIGRRRKLGTQLRTQNYHQAIVLPNSFKSALVPWFAKIPRRTGWRGELRYGLLNDMRILDAARLPQMTQRFTALGRQATEAPPPAIPPQLQSDAQIANAQAQKHGLLRAKNTLALCPGAEFGSAKRWPTKHYAEVARHYLDRGWQVVLLGSASDAEICAQVVAAISNQKNSPGSDSARCVNLAGQTTLTEVIDLMSLVTAVVSNDSGLMHVAAALGKPVVALYGPTSPLFTPPQSERAVVIASQEKCAPCFERECPLSHQRCLQEISPQQVLLSLEGCTAAAECAQ